MWRSAWGSWCWRGMLALLSFMAGAAHSAWLINFGRRFGWRSRYALPLLVEAGLLLCFGIMGAVLPAEMVAIPVVPLLCFLMGVQNACITKISGARIRTTHVTGIVTDLGIEIGKLTYWNADARSGAPRSSPIAPRCGCSPGCSPASPSAGWSARWPSAGSASPPACRSRWCC